VMRPLESDRSNEILRYFEVRLKWERHEYVVPVADDLEFLNEARRRFEGARVESLFEAWSAGKITESELRREFSQPDRAVLFETFRVEEHGSPLSVIVRHGGGCLEDKPDQIRRRSRHPLGDVKLLGI